MRSDDAHMQFKIKFNELFPTFTIVGEYINSTTKILVSDKYGNLFLATPNYLSQGKRLSILSAIDKNAYFIFLSNQTHEFKYDYRNVKYVDSKSKVSIFCHKHGSFSQSPNNHLKGYGCSKCGTLSSSNKKSKSSNCYFNQVKNIHNDFYSYEKSTYTNVRSKIIITCPIHGDFRQGAKSHLEGHGCKKCNTSGYSRSAWTEFCFSRNKNVCTCYVIRCFNDLEEFIKIGITSNDVNERFNNKILMPYSFEILKEFKGSPDFIWDKEKELHRLCKALKFTPSISFSGETECFNVTATSLLF